MPTPTNAPVKKVSIGAVAGGFVTLVVAVLNKYVPFFDGANAISAEITGPATTFFTFLVSYWVSPAPEETTETVAGQTVSAKK